MIKDVWRLKAVERYKDMMRNLKNSRKKPSYFSKETWKNFEQYWNDPEVIQWSELYSRNCRGTINAPGPSTHTGESITYIEWLDKSVIFIKTDHKFVIISQFTLS